MPGVSGSALEECRTEQARMAARLAELEALLGEEELDESPDQPWSELFLEHGFFACVCVVLAALAAGLTMGLVSLEPMEMEIIVKSEEEDITDVRDKVKLKADQSAAMRILPLIKDHHRLLVTLLLLNSLANEALPLFLDKLVPSWLAVVLSVTLVLLFGEIIPSAVFTGSEQLRIAAKFAPLVSGFRVVLAPVAWPIAKVLDCFLGEDHKGRYNFAELRAIVGIHARLHTGEPEPVAFKGHDHLGLGIITAETQHHFTEDSVVTFTGESTKLRPGKCYYVKPCAPLKGRDNTFTFKLYSSEGRRSDDLITYNKGELTNGLFHLQERDELKIMHGVMNLTHMTAKDAMVPLREAWMLEENQLLTKSLLKEIHDSGYSRIPVYSSDKHNVRGFMLVKKLIVVSPADDRDAACSVKSLGLDKLVVVPHDILMLDLLNKFQEDRCHMALVTNLPLQVTQAWESGAAIPPDVHMAGIMTLEDVIEKLLQEDIEDEHDAAKISQTTAPTMSVRRSISGRKLSEKMSSLSSLRETFHSDKMSPSSLRDPLLS